MEMGGVAVVYSITPAMLAMCANTGRMADPELAKKGAARVQRGRQKYSVTRARVPRQCSARSGVVRSGLGR